MSIVSFGTCSHQIEVGKLSFFAICSFEEATAIEQAIISVTPIINDGGTKSYDNEWWIDMANTPKFLLINALKSANQRADRAEEILKRGGQTQ